MMIDDDLNSLAPAGGGLAAGHASRAPRSPVRLLLEALWILCWHGGKAVVNGFALALLARRVARERSALRGMSDRELADIGIDRAGALHEAARHWLDLPAHRRRDVP